MKLVVLISGNGSNLQAIIDSVEADRLQADICAVISNRPEAYGLQRAAKHGISHYVIDHKDYPNRESFDQALQNQLDRLQPDLIVLAGFMRILSLAFVEHFEGRLINIHPSLLPKFKGLDTHRRALRAGETEHGCSVHFVTPELDSGAIIAQARVTIAANETPASLSDKVQAMEHKLYPACIRLINHGAQLTEQGICFDGKLLPRQGLDLTDEFN